MMSNSTGIDPEVIEKYYTDFSELYATTFFGFASYTVLVWDHFITFGDEVKYIWSGGSKKTLIICLFMINRYLIPLGFILNLHAYLWPGWTPELCSHFVRFEGALTNIGLGISGLMMMIRVVAVYGGSKIVFAFLFSIFCTEVGVNAWLMTKGIAVAHDPGVHGCSMIFSPSVGPWASASAWLPLLYDTVVLVLTLYKTITVAKLSSQNIMKDGSMIARTLIQDGLLYYSMIFLANFVLIIMILTAPPGLKNICAQFELLITVTMMSRITISLRKNVRDDEDDWILDNYQTRFAANRSIQWTFGMGGPIEENEELLDDNDNELTLHDLSGTIRRRESGHVTWTVGNA